MKIFAKTQHDGKSIYCYGIDLSIASSIFDPQKHGNFGRFTPDPLSYGFCIEPLSGEYLTRAKIGEPLGLPKDEFQNNSICMFFTRPKSIDTVIKNLNLCKEELCKRIEAAEEEERRRMHMGEVIWFRDLQCLVNAK